VSRAVGCSPRQRRRRAISRSQERHGYASVIGPVFLTVRVMTCGAPRKLACGVGYGLAVDRPCTGPHVAGCYGGLRQVEPGTSARALEKECQAPCWAAHDHPRAMAAPVGQPLHGALKPHDDMTLIWFRMVARAAPGLTWSAEDWAHVSTCHPASSVQTGERAYGSHGHTSTDSAMLSDLNLSGVG